MFQMRICVLRVGSWVSSREVRYVSQDLCSGVNSVMMGSGVVSKGC